MFQTSHKFYPETDKKNHKIQYRNTAYFLGKKKFSHGVHQVTKTYNFGWESHKALSENKEQSTQLSTFCNTQYPNLQSDESEYEMIWIFITTRYTVKLTKCGFPLFWEMCHLQSGFVTTSYILHQQSQLLYYSWHHNLWFTESVGEKLFAACGVYRWGSHRGQFRLAWHPGWNRIPLHPPDQRPTPPCRGPPLLHIYKYHVYRILSLIKIHVC